MEANAFTIYVPSGAALAGYLNVKLEESCKQLACKVWKSSAEILSGLTVVLVFEVLK